MKRAVALLILGALCLSLAACRKKVKDPTYEPASPSEWVEREQETQQTEPGSPTEGEELVTFWDEQPEMKTTEAIEIIQKEDADVTTEEYRKAVYTVNEDKATQVVEEALETKLQTPEVTKLFEGIGFHFIEGDTFKSARVKKELSKRGTYAYNEEKECYWFTFHDRTLAQSATGIEDQRSLKEYTQTLEWLLADPNVTVEALLD